MKNTMTNSMVPIMLSALTITITAACIEPLEGNGDALADESPALDSLDSLDSLPEDMQALVGQPYDFERQMWLSDTDDDTFPDVTEDIEGTDPNDRADFPGKDDVAAKVGFPAGSCRSGFRNAGPRLCISTTTFSARQYQHAILACRNARARVCKHQDLTYLYYGTSLDASYDPLGKWIGNVVDDDRVLRGNRSITFNNDPDIANFDATALRTDHRAFWCCHDDDL